MKVPSSLQLALQLTPSCLGMTFLCWLTWDFGMVFLPIVGMAAVAGCVVCVVREATGW